MLLVTKQRLQRIQWLFFPAPNHPCHTLSIRHRIRCQRGSGRDRRRGKGMTTLASGPAENGLPPATREKRKDTDRLPASDARKRAPGCLCGTQGGRRNGFAGRPKVRPISRLCPGLDSSDRRHRRRPGGALPINGSAGLHRADEHHSGEPLRETPSRGIQRPVRVLEAEPRRRCARRCSPLRGEAPHGGEGGDRGDALRRDACSPWHSAGSPHRPRCKGEIDPTRGRRHGGQPMSDNKTLADWASACRTRAQGSAPDSLDLADAGGHRRQAALHRRPISRLPVISARCPALHRSPAVRAPPCMPGGPGRSGNMPASPPPKPRMPSTARRSPPASRASPSPSISPPIAAMTRIIRASSAMSARPAWRSIRSRT